MDEQVLMKSKIAKEEKRFSLSIVIIVLVNSLVLLLVCLHWANSIRQCSVYFKNWSLGNIIFGNTLYRNAWLIAFMIAHWLVLLIAVALLFNYLAKNRCDLVITQSKVVGKTSFNDNIVVFLRDIVQVAISEDSKKLTIYTMAGKTTFYFIQNCSEIGKLIISLMEKTK